MTYDPGGTAAHVVPALLGELRPLGHGAHCVWLDVAAMVFSSHSSQVIVAREVDARPGAHSIHATDPKLSAYDPGGHATRPAFSPSHLYPGSHFIVSFVLALTYDPGGTGTQSVAPSPVVLCPAVQARQVIAPGSLETVFFAHLRQETVAKAADARPGGHSTQPTDPLLLAYEPGAHATRPAFSPSHL